MQVFNSLGSNYDLSFVVRALFASNDEAHTVALKTFLEKKYAGQAVLVYKGREALRLALRASNVKGSTVAICGFTCFAVYDAIKKEGHEVEYLDIEKNTLHFSYDTFKKSVEKNQKIKIVIVQNTLGYPYDDIERTAAFCKENNIILIEDLAHSIGAVYSNKQEAGTLGDFTILSFSQDKVVDGISGGALIVRNPKFNLSGHEESFSKIPQKKQMIDRLYPLFTFKIRKTYVFGIGKILHALLKRLHVLSNPMSDSTDIHSLPSWYCSLIYREFLNIEKNLAHRKKIATIYLEKLKSKALISISDRPIVPAVSLRFPLFLNNRESLITFLKEKNIFVSDIWYDSPIAPKQFLNQTNYQKQCPHAEAVCSIILNLPTHKNVSAKKAQKIIDKINLWLTLQ